MEERIMLFNEFAEEIKYRVAEKMGKSFISMSGTKKKMY